jgi:pimeloyl-ACP methyl ester carboxylesterase
MALPLWAAALLVATASVAAAPTNGIVPEEQNLADYLSGNAPGLYNSTITTSAGGKAICVTGYVDVSVSAMNLKLDLVEPQNGTDLIAIVLKVVSANSNFGNETVKGQVEVSGTYSIFSQLCFPRNSPTIDTSSVHFLIHGGGYDSRYWDPAPGYSYVDVAASHGHAVFNYDRLGAGRSTRANPLSDVQKPMHIAIAHSLIQSLRNGAFLNHTFDNVFGVGHSFGTNILYGLTSTYPDDLSAAILTGYTISETTGQFVAISGLNAGLAAEVDPSRWGGLPGGYVVSNNAHGTQMFFLHWPDCSAELAGVSDLIKETTALGELLGFSDKITPTNFTGLTAVVDGQNDLPNCDGDCVGLGSKTRAQELLEFAYPDRREGSSSYIVEGSGHGINFHYGAEAAFEWILELLKSGGF